MVAETAKKEEKFLKTHKHKQTLTLVQSTLNTNADSCPLVRQSTYYFGNKNGCL